MLSFLLILITNGLFFKMKVFLLESIPYFARNTEIKLTLNMKNDSQKGFFPERFFLCSTIKFDWKEVET